MLKVGVIGSTGYTGEEIVKVLSGHREVEITVLQAIVEKDAPYSDLFPALKGKVDIVCTKPNFHQAVLNADLFFLALPHTVSMEVAPIFLKKGKKVIDLSADYRLELGEYEKWYGTKHKDRANIEKAVYGLPEINRKQIHDAKLVANPGCYPTGASLAVAPLLKKNLVNPDTIIIDSKSGATGAGRKASVALCFSEISENMKAYKINEHQHKPEINMVLSGLSGSQVNVVFVPHLVPLNRGILTTAYLDLEKDLETEKILSVYEAFYENEPFIKVMKEGELPTLRDAQHTNACVIGIKVTGEKLVAVSAIDNLLKGAAGQAVQNMNIMYGFDEKEGLA